MPIHSRNISHQILSRQFSILPNRCRASKQLDMAIRGSPCDAGFVRPPPVHSASVVRVFSPAGAVEEHALKAGRAYLEKEGYRVDQPGTVTERYNYFAGNAASRAGELHEAVLKRVGRHESIIWAARGGYGSSQMIENGLSADMLDDLLAELAQNPKWLVGYSDITVLSLHIWAQAKVLVLHGPMVVNITEYRLEAIDEMWAILRGSEPLTQVFPGNIRYGRGQGLLATGRLLGGNLEVISSMLGAKDLRGESLVPCLDGCILLLEEVNEAPCALPPRPEATLCSIDVLTACS